MSGLNIAERRLPQDGAVKLAVRGKEIDLRIATAPVTHGEAAAVRILDKSAVTLDFDALGFDATMQAKLNALLDRPNGIVLVTGPTGSGKTTTLYAALQRLNTPTRKILSVEDPVEYKIAGVNQVQVKPDIGLTFAHVLRSFLRHDPDVILVGEIRDPETARIAVQASLTGHLVLSTVHTNSAAAAITRLIDMHVEDYLLSSTVIGILAQRLVRVLCRSCKTPIDIAPEWQREADALGIREPKLFAAKGCAACHGTGYRGRTVIAELLTPDDAVRRMIVDRAAAAHIHAGAVSHGMESLRRNGLRRALEGRNVARRNLARRLRRGMTMPARQRKATARAGERGYSLLELLVVLAILGLIIAIAAPRVIGYFDASKAKTAQIQISNIAAALDLYYLANGAYPSEQQGLKALVERPEGVQAGMAPT